MDQDQEYLYSVFYTFQTDVPSEVVAELQEDIFAFLDEEYGLEAVPTGYGHHFGQDIPVCGGLTQDLQFLYFRDVQDFVYWLKDIPEICRISYSKWNEKKGDVQYSRHVKDES